jgi:uncharacterized protein
MKLLAFSDLHRDTAAAEAIVAASANADVVIGAGDFATMGQGLDDTISILRRITVPVVLVAGNHDSLDDLRAACAGWNNVHALHGQSVTIAGINIFGLGFEISTVDRGAWNSHMSESDAATHLAHCPANCILVTHAPPFGVADLQRNGEREGSLAIRATIEHATPSLNLCGHIHHAWGTSGVIGHTPVHNLGPKPNWFDI